MKAPPKELQYFADLCNDDGVDCNRPCCDRSPFSPFPVAFSTNYSPPVTHFFNAIAKSAMKVEYVFNMASNSRVQPWLILPPGYMADCGL